MTIIWHSWTKTVILYMIYADECGIIVCMKNRYRKKRYATAKRHRRPGLSASKWGPLVKLTGAVVGILAAITLLVFLGMLLLEAVFKIDTPLKPDGIVGKIAGWFNVEQPLIASPTPYITPEPSPTPHPMDLFSGEDEEKEIVFPADVTYPWVGDPYCYNDIIICSAGKLEDGRAVMSSLIRYNITTGVLDRLPIDATNDHLLFPAFNDNWLVYFDGHYENGGGNICALDLTTEGAEPIIIKEVYTGQPELKLDGDYVSWLERTGSDRDKIFVCCLSTQETTVVQYFNKSSYGTSMPSLVDGIVAWAAEDNVYHEDGRTTSVIKYLKITDATISEYHPDVYVHDPEYNGTYFAWLDAHHSENTKLYYSDGVTAPVIIDTGVVEFGLSDTYIAYGKGNAVWVYVFQNGKSYRITPERENAQFLGVSGGCIMWMDVTSRDRDIVKYTKLPI